MNLQEILATGVDGLIDADLAQNSDAIKSFLAFMALAGESMRNMKHEAPKTHGDMAIASLAKMFQALQKRDDAVYKKIGVIEREAAVTMVKQVYSQMVGD